MCLKRYGPGICIADWHMDLTGFTHLLAMFRNEESNAIVCDRYRHSFGPKNVFSIHAGTSGEREELAHGIKRQVLFNQEATWSKLASLFAQGAVIRSTPLTAEYNFEHHRAKRGKDDLPLFALGDKGMLIVFTNKDEVEPGKNWLVITLANENSNDNGNGES